MSFSCNASDPLGGNVNVGYIEPAQQIEVDYSDPDASTDTAAALNVGHFAEYFSTASVGQLEFGGWVRDTMDSLAVGATATQAYPPLRLVLKRPNTNQWKLAVEQS